MYFVALGSMRDRCCPRLSLRSKKGHLSACMSSWQPCSAGSVLTLLASALRNPCAPAQTVVMLTYVLALNWERESRRARATFTPPASAPAVGAETTGAVDSGGAANGDLEQGAALLNVNGGSGAAAPGAAAAVPDQPLGVAAGAGALAPGHEAPVRQALL